MSGNPAYLRVAGDTFTEFIRENAGAKLVRGSELTGKSFAFLARKFVEDVGRKHINIESTYQVWTLTTCSETNIVKIFLFVKENM